VMERIRPCGKDSRFQPEARGISSLSRRRPAAHMQDPATSPLAKARCRRALRHGKSAPSTSERALTSSSGRGRFRLEAATVCPERRSPSPRRRWSDHARQPRCEAQRRSVTTLYAAWAISAGVLLLLAIAFGVGVRASSVGILIDQRGRYSLTQLQIVLWTIVVISLISGVFWARLFDDATTALDVSIPGELLGVLGISVGSTVAAMVVKAEEGRVPPGLGSCQ